MVNIVVEDWVCCVGRELGGKRGEGDSWEGVDKEGAQSGSWKGKMRRDGQR